MRKKICFAALLIVSMSVYASEGVKLSKQAKALLAGDICAQAAVASVRDYISELNYDSGTDIPDGGYPLPYVKQILAYENGSYSVLVVNYPLPTLNVMTMQSANGCVADRPTYEIGTPESL
jgi:hypothetical protein